MFKYCPKCGDAGIGPIIDHSQICSYCKTQHWYNPKPVAVAVIPLITSIFDLRIKFLCIQRNIPPGVGCWAFPSGYVDQGESIEHAASREVTEEIGIDLDADTARIIRTSPTENGHLLCFVEFPPVELGIMDKVHLDAKEVSAANWQTYADDWAFPLHQEMAETYAPSGIQAHLDRIAVDRDLFIRRFGWVTDIKPKLEVKWETPHT